MDVKAATLRKVEMVFRSARQASAPGPHGLPYRLCKNAADVFQFL